MEFNSLVQITHMYLRSNYHFENIILHKRFTQYCRIATSNSDLKSQCNFLTFKEFHPLNDPGGYVQKIFRKICHVRSIFEWKMSHISWLCITIFLHVFFCCWNLESMSTSTFFWKFTFSATKLFHWYYINFTYSFCLSSRSIGLCKI